MSMSLGVVSTLLGTLIGPSFKALMDLDSPNPSSIRELVGPWFGALFENFLGKNYLTSMELVSLLPYALISLAGVKAIISFSQWSLWENLSENIASRMRIKIIKSFSQLDLSSRHLEEVVKLEENLSAAISNDTRMFREFIVHYYGGAPREAFQVLSGLVGLYLLSPYLFLICFFGILPAAAVLRGLGKKIHKRSSHSLNQFSELSEFIQERLLGLETIKHYRTEFLEMVQVNNKISSLLESYKKLAKIKARTSPLLELVAVFAMVGLIFFAFQGMSQQKISGSIFMSFLGSLAILSQSFSKLGKYFNINRESYAAIDRVRGWVNSAEFYRQKKPTKIATLVESSNIRKNISDSKSKKRLVLENIHFSYPNGEKVLSGVSFEFNEGKIYSLAGPSGAGKSTCMKVLLGVLLPDQGRVYFQGLPSPRIGYMPQSIALFAGTILENLAWPSETLSVAKAEEALRQVDLWKKVTSLPNGVDHVFSFGAKDFSGGQCQRLLLARLFCQSFDAVLIDEGTSGVDPESERIILEGIKKLAESGTVVVTIAHRKSMLAFSDEILVFDEGKILKNGPFEIVSKELEIPFVDGIDENKGNQGTI